MGAQIKMERWDIWKLTINCNLQTEGAEVDWQEDIITTEEDGSSICTGSIASGRSKARTRGSQRSKDIVGQKAWCRGHFGTRTARKVTKLKGSEIPSEKTWDDTRAWMHDRKTVRVSSKRYVGEKRAQQEAISLKMKKEQFHSDSDKGR